MLYQSGRGESNPHSFVGNERPEPVRTTAKLLMLGLGVRGPMPEDLNEHVAAAAEHAAEVLEEPPPSRKGSVKAEKLKGAAALVLAAASLLASLGAFLKTFDHSTTEGTYKTTSDLIVKLNERQEKTDQQVAAIRGYLDGLSHTPIMGTVGPPPAPSEEPAPPPTHRPSHPPTAPASTSLVSVPHGDAGVITFVIPKTPPSSAPLPPPMAPAAAVRPPPFDVAKGNI